MIADAGRIKAMRRQADAQIMKWGNNPASAPPIAIRYKMHLRGTEPVLLEKNLLAGGRRSGPVRDVETINMPVYDRFEGEKFTKLPYGDIIP